MTTKVLQRFTIAATFFFLKESVLPARAMTPRWVTKTRYTRTTTAGIIINFAHS